MTDETIQRSDVPEFLANSYREALIELHEATQGRATKKQRQNVAEIYAVLRQVGYGNKRYTPKAL